MTLELNKVYNENCLETMKRMPDNSVDSIVTDPPYGLKFMNKKWDAQVPEVAIWQEVLRVLKPGGYLLCFASTRTYHRMVCNIEDAGFEIRNQIAWVFGSGFPKSLNISKQIDKDAGAEREVIGKSHYAGRNPNGRNRGDDPSKLYGKDARTDEETALITAPATADAIRYDGWGTDLKPAYEPICVARKPLEGTVVQNILKWGTGGLNIDGCRVTTGEDTRRPSSGGDNGMNQSSTFKIRERRVEDFVQQSGRFPSNFIHDGSDEVLELFPESADQQGDLVGHSREIESPNGIYSKQPPRYDAIARNDVGSAARFFYCAKTSKTDRNEGIDDGNHHVTVKPCSLMIYLCRLVTPVDGIIYDPFSGSGSTGKAAMIEGFRFIGSELDAHHTDISNARIQYAIENREKLIDEYKLDHVEKVMPKKDQLVDDSNYF